MHEIYSFVTKFIHALTHISLGIELGLGVCKYLVLLPSPCPGVIHPRLSLKS